MRAFLGLVACASLSLLSLPASAGTWANLCGTSGQSKTVSRFGDPGSIGCYSFAAADSTHYGPLFRIEGTSATVDFDPDTGGTAAGGAAVKVFMCPQERGTDATVDATLELGCIDLGGANGNVALDGTEGEPGTQNRYKVLYPGVYFLKVTGACGSGDVCVVSVKGN